MADDGADTTEAASLNVQEEIVEYWGLRISRVDVAGGGGGQIFLSTDQRKAGGTTPIPPFHPLSVQIMAPLSLFCS